MNNRKINLAIIDAIKLCARLGIVLQDPRDTSKYNPEIEHAPTSAGVVNFVHAINYDVRNGNKVLENHLKTCRNVKHISQQLLKCCYQVITEGILRGENLQDFCYNS